MSRCCLSVDVGCCCCCCWSHHRSGSCAVNCPLSSKFREAAVIFNSKSSIRGHISGPHEWLSAANSLCLATTEGPQMAYWSRFSCYIETSVRYSKFVDLVRGDIQPTDFAFYWALGLKSMWRRQLSSQSTSNRRWNTFCTMVLWLCGKINERIDGELANCPWSCHSHQ